MLMCIDSFDILLDNIVNIRDFTSNKKKKILAILHHINRDKNREFYINKISIYL